MVSRMTLATVGVLAVLILTGCSQISEGYITAKKHRAAYTYTSTVCVSYGKHGCTAWMPQVHTVPESWWFDIVSGTHGIDDHEPQSGWVYVGPQTFAEYEVGDYFESKEN